MNFAKRCLPVFCVDNVLRQSLLFWHLKSNCHIWSGSKKYLINICDDIFSAWNFLCCLKQQLLLKPRFSLPRLQQWFTHRVCANLYSCLQGVGIILCMLRSTQNPVRRGKASSKWSDKLIRGEICVANFLLPCKWCESRQFFSQKLTFFKKGKTKTALAPKRANFF